MIILKKPIDHTQYTLVDGTRAFTGTVSGISPTEDAHLATKWYVDTISGGGGVSDHGALTGLSDDDHTQYSLAGGTRPFTDTVSGVSPTDNAHLTTKAYVDDAITTATGSLTSDHGGLIGLDDDDHGQYSLANGTRPFTGTVSGVSPTEDAHLVTKAYVTETIATPAKKHVVLGPEDVKLGAPGPTEAVIGNFSVLQFNGTSGIESVYTGFHIPTDWSEGTDVTTSIRWAPTDTTSGVVVWHMMYDPIATNSNELVSNSGTHTFITDSSQNLQDELLQTGVMTISGSELALEDTIGMTFFRDPLHDSDTYVSSASLVAIELRYTADKRGSAPGMEEPIITLHPQSAEVQDGAAVVFSVEAIGASPIYYQWEKDTVDIEGETSTSYTIDSAQVSDEGIYTCRVYNTYGSVTSSGAELVVLLSYYNIYDTFTDSAGTRLDAHTPDATLGVSNWTAETMTIGNNSAINTGITSTDVVTNGDMELNSNWATFVGGTNSQSSTQAHGGTYSWEVICDGTYQGITSDTWSATAGQTINITGWVYPSASTAAHVRVYSPVNGVTIETDYFFTGLTSGTWNALVFSHVYRNSGSLGRISLSNYNAGADTYYWDDWEVKINDLSEQFGYITLLDKDGHTETSINAILGANNGCVARANADFSKFLIGYYNHHTGRVCVDFINDGNSSTLINTTQSFSNGKKIIIVCEGDQMQVFYNISELGSIIDISSYGFDDTNNIFGLYADGENASQYIYQAATGSLNYESIMDPGKGTFTVDTESWVAASSNTIEVDNGALKITYVNHSHGAIFYLKQSGSDLSEDLVQRNLYRIQYDCKVNSGTSVQLRESLCDARSPVITNTDWETHYWYLVSASTTGADIRCTDLGSGEILWLDNFSVNKMTYNA